MSTRIYKTWVERILSGTFTRGECNQWAQAVVPLSEDLPPGGKRTVLEPHEARGLRQLMWHRGGVRLHDDHTQQGLKWIKTHEDQFPEGMLDRFSHFTFQGDAYDIDTSGWRPQCIPTWRIHLQDGTMIDYTAIGWQTGQEPDLILEPAIPPIRRTA